MPITLLLNDFMPIGPIGQQPVNPLEDSRAELSHPQGAVAQPEPPPVSKNAARVQAGQQAQADALAFGDAQRPAAKGAATIAAQLVQDARTAKTSGSQPSIAAPLGDLVNAVTSQMGVKNLTDEQKQSVVARLADDPVVKSLIG